MIITKVDNINDAKQCNKLLTKLIKSESKINNNIKNNYVVSEYFEKIYEQTNSIIYVAKVGDVVVGYVFCKCITSENSPEIEAEALIDGLYVEEEYRRKGIATKLLEQAQMWCRKNNIKYIQLNVLEENKSAMNLYRLLGYKDFERKLKLELENIVLI